MRLIGEQWVPNERLNPNLNVRNQMRHLRYELFDSTVASVSVGRTDVIPRNHGLGTRFIRHNDNDVMHEG